MSDKMSLREVLGELQEGAPVKLGLKSGYYYCGPLPENWESMIEEEHRRDMRYFCKELDSCENDMITFTGRWNDRLVDAIEEAQKEPGIPGAIEADVAEAIRTNHQARLKAWDSLLRRIGSITAELHSPAYLDRPVTSIYDSIDPDEKPGTICILVDGIMTGKYYSSKEYKAGKGSAHGRRKTDNASAGL